MVSFVVHRLKTWPAPFNAVWTGRKRHEIRVDDRNFNAGDSVVLEEYDPDTLRYSGRTVHAVITYKSEGGTWGLPENLCVLSLGEPLRTGGAA